MRHGGSDMLAIAGILGGGLIAGGVTLALASGPEVPSVECATTVGPDADVVVSLGNKGLVMVTPDVRVREVRECMAGHADVEHHVVSVHASGEVDRVRREVDEARREADRVRREVDRVRDGVRRRQVDISFRADEADVARVRVEQVREALESQREELQRDVQARQREIQARQREIQARQRDRQAVQRDVQARERDREAMRRDRQRALERAQREVARAAREGVLRLRSDVDGETEIEIDGSLADGLDIRMPNRSFHVRLQGLEDQDFDALSGEELEAALRTQLEVLEGLEFEFDFDGIEGLDEDLSEQIQQRIDYQRHHFSIPQH